MSHKHVLGLWFLTWWFALTFITVAASLPGALTGHLGPFTFTGF